MLETETTRLETPTHTFVNKHVYSQFYKQSTSLIEQICWCIYCRQHHNAFKRHTLTDIVVGCMGLLKMDRKCQADVSLLFACLSSVHVSLCL